MIFCLFEKFNNGQWELVYVIGLSIMVLTSFDAGIIVHFVSTRLYNLVSSF